MIARIFFAGKSRADSIPATLMACGGQKQEATDAPSAASPESSQETQVVGGWTLPESFSGSLSNEAADAFDKAKENYKEEVLFPTCQLGSQVVAGTNYMILCADEARTQWKVAIVYEDLAGDAQITKVTNFDLGKYAQDDSGQAGEQNLSGGWTVFKDPSGQGTELPQAVEAAFKSAMEGMTGADYLPVLYMGTQVVNGANYALLCEQTLVTADPVTNLALVYIYAPATGDPEVMNIYPLNLADFNK